MDKVEELLRKRKWAKDCLRVNIAQPDQIITRGTTGKVKSALVKSNLLRKNEHELREAIRFIAPEWWDDETQVILNHNVQCKRHKDSNKEHSWIIFLGDFTGGALCFEDGTRVEEHYRWHKFDGHQYHWNEPHEGEKFSIVLYRSGAKKTKIQQITEAKQKKRTPQEQPKEPKQATSIDELIGAFTDAVTGEFMDMVIKLLKPIKDRVNGIPDPVAGSGPGLERIPEAA